MICKKCGWWERLCHCKELVLFNTTRDKLFHFVDYNNFNQPVEIRGKDHFDKLCRQKNLTWRDVKQAPRESPDFIKDKYRPVDRRVIADCIHQELKDKGLHGKLLKKRR